MEITSRRKVLGGAFLVGLLLIASGIVLDLVVFPAAIRSRILENVQLRRGSDAMERFIRLPQPIVLRVFLFNVTNPHEVYLGKSPPKLQEIGPYSYHIYREKVEMEEDLGSDTLSFYQISQYFFRRELSIGDEDDLVTVLNVPMLGLINQATKSLPITPPFFSSVVQDLFTDPAEKYSSSYKFMPFLKSSVRKLLFEGVPIRCGKPRAFFTGYIGKTLLCTGIGMNLPQSMRKAEEDDRANKGNYLFSFLGYKNNSREGPAVVRRGMKKPEEVGQVLFWKGQTEMKSWGPSADPSNPCNKVVGIDASTFAPFVSEKSVIKVFQPELCRPVSAVFEKEVEFRGIPAMRFVADIDLFATPDVKPENWCYYPTGDDTKRDQYWSTIETGVQDLSACLGAPIVVSFPHFYGASSNYLKYAKGLHPEKSLHETYVEIESMTGSPLNAAKKLQFNMYLKRDARFPFLWNVTEGLFPVMWAEEGMKLDDKFSRMLKEELFDVINILKIIKWTMISVGVLEIIAVLIFARSRWMSKKEDSADQKLKEANLCYEMSKKSIPYGIAESKEKEADKPPT
ncbi:hypothetical protein J437_LFUL010800 [Ladona fulva]|uniref:Sensory neuron membrane protein 2 n=1 Tax=Ladona fulva TaxID=123851 RepID=A0A8K0KT96_LADFU|nr:hypothetical protein J437_LFUL010800 [Ladona fulva]